jgi:tRNA(fMet)-specific endonuclease VapC
VVGPRYLLDTNVLSEPARARPDRGIVEGLRRHGDLLATASVVWHELLFGAERLPGSKRRRAIEAYLAELHAAASLKILPYDEAAARVHAVDRAYMEKRGRPVPFRDSQIAAIAKVYGLTLVTANLRDYEPIPGLEVEDWRAGGR